jgi:hypothetical protein
VNPIPFKRHRFPPDVIRYAVWLYFRFTMSFRDVEELLAERGIEVSYETIRCWTIKFGPQIAANLKARRPAPSPRWHLDDLPGAVSDSQPSLNPRGRPRAVRHKILLKLGPGLSEAKVRLDPVTREPSSYSVAIQSGQMFRHRLLASSVRRIFFGSSHLACLSVDGGRCGIASLGIGRRLRLAGGQRHQTAGQERWDAATPSSITHQAR